jgi:hypothetical protein
MQNQSHRPIHWLLVTVNALWLGVILWDQPAGFRAVAYPLIALFNIALFTRLALRKIE